MAFSREPVAKLDRRRALAQQIIDRHTEDERERVWRAYIKRLGPMARYHVKTARSLPEQLAEVLEPRALDRMMAADD